MARSGYGPFAAVSGLGHARLLCSCWCRSNKRGEARLGAAGPGRHAAGARDVHSRCGGSARSRPAPRTGARAVRSLNRCSSGSAQRSSVSLMSRNARSRISLARAWSPSSASCAACSASQYGRKQREPVARKKSRPARNASTPSSRSPLSHRTSASSTRPRRETPECRARCKPSRARRRSGVRRRLSQEEPEPRRVRQRERERERMVEAVRELDRASAGGERRRVVAADPVHPATVVERHHRGVLSELEAVRRVALAVVHGHAGVEVGRGGREVRKEEMRDARARGGPPVAGPRCLPRPRAGTPRMKGRARSSDSRARNGTSRGRTAPGTAAARRPRSRKAPGRGSTSPRRRTTRTPWRQPVPGRARAAGRARSARAQTRRGPRRVLRAHFSLAPQPRRARCAAATRVPRLTNTGRPCRAHGPHRSAAPGAPARVARSPETRAPGPPRCGGGGRRGST